MHVGETFLGFSEPLTHTPSVASTSEENVNYSIEKAHEIFKSGIWSKASTLHRSKVLSRLARLLEERIQELAELETMQTGRTIREMRTQLGRLPEWLLVTFSSSRMVPYLILLTVIITLLYCAHIPHLWHQLKASY
jgi:hypothetical protein